MNASLRKPFVCLALFGVGLCLFFGCALIFVAQLYGVDGPTVHEGQLRAQPLLTALEQYKTDTGSYPPDLQTLIPNYLLEIPRPARRWEYMYEAKGNGDKFVLSFEVGRNFDGDYCTYVSEAKLWTCSDSI
ncbi:MAG TPA: hypothetical protein PK530_19825 [Anaerolineales bacterium]|nr:hypothetical protein [Anaerolineales bacterium]